MKTSKNDQMFKLYAALHEVTASDALFGLPPEEERMQDIQYIYGVMVSSGMNLNGAVFLPSELIYARDTMIGKALDVEHIEYASVGHIYDRAFMWKDGKVFDPLSLFDTMGASVDNASFDVAILSQLWKYRYGDIAQEVSDGKYKLSMECYYEDFDILVGDVILSQSEAKKAGLPLENITRLSGQGINVVMPGGERRRVKMGKVLRGILFSGVGLVEDPANPDSLIREAASTTEVSTEELDFVMDLNKCDSVKKMLKNSTSTQNNFTKPADSITNKAGGLVEEPSEKARSTNQGVCVSYKRYVYSYEPTNDEIAQPPGVGADPGPDDHITHTNWCTLFDAPCSTLAGDATDARCLRNVLNRTSKEVIGDMDRLNDFLFSGGLGIDEYDAYQTQIDELVNTNDDVKNKE